MGLAWYPAGWDNGVPTEWWLIDHDHGDALVLVHPYGAIVPRPVTRLGGVR